VENLPDKFCAFPYFLTNIKNDGKVSLCRCASEKIAHDDRPLSLHTETFGQIWNSHYMRSVRRRMLDGESIDACRGCHASEAEGGKTPRQGSTIRARVAMQVTDDGELLAKARAIVEEQQGIAPPPAELHLWLGNLCNMKCRTCSATFSSQIGGDAVHSSWMGDLIRTQILLPHYLQGVDYEGFGQLVEGGQGTSREVSSEGAAITLPGNTDPVASIEIEGFNRSGFPCRASVALGDVVVARQWLLRGAWRIFIEPEAKDSLNGIRLSLSFQGAGQRIEISHLKVAVKSAGGKKPPRELVSRIAENPNWFRSEEVVFGEVLAHTDHVRQVVFSGGEPLINRMLPVILKRLVAGGRSDQMGVYFTTNGTVHSRNLTDLCQQFRAVEIGFSLDGIGAVQEYIRPPAKWSRIEENVIAFRDDGLPISIRPTVQAYNVFDLLDLLRFCDRQGIPFVLDNLLSCPRYLSLDMLPEAVISEALAEWLRYQDTECRSCHRSEVETVIAALRRPRPEAGELAILQDEFIRFTNDLDRSREEDFASACPRLYHCLVAAGFDFHGKYRFTRRRSRAQLLVPTGIRRILRQSYRRLEDDRGYGAVHRRWLLHKLKWIMLRVW